MEDAVPVKYYQKEMEGKIQIKYIDIRKIICERSSGLLKKLPGFVFRIISIIICQEQMNYIINKYRNSNGAEFLEKVIEELNITLDVEGLENLPESRRCIFAANHPFGIADGLVMTYIVSQKYGTLKAIANDSFMYIPQLHPFIAAIDVFEGSSKEYLQQLEDIYKQDVPLTHFPSGEVSRRWNGKIQDQPWQKSFITKAISSEREIVPLHFHGTNSRLFYLIHSTRMVLGIKANLELILLPRELFLKRGKTIKVTIGKPIHWRTFDKSLTHYQWAQRVRSTVYELGTRVERIAQGA